MGISVLDILWDECLFDPLAASIRGETPLHLVKSVEILKIFMNRMVNFNRWDIVITEQKDFNGNTIFENLLRMDTRMAETTLDYYIRPGTLKEPIGSIETKLPIPLESEDLVVYFNLKGFLKDDSENTGFTMEYHSNMIEHRPQVI